MNRIVGLLLMLSVMINMNIAQAQQTTQTEQFDQQYMAWKQAQPVVSFRSSGKKINLNTAGIEELQTLVGVGENKAKEILNYRKKHGKFERIDQLKEVKGFGESLYQKNKAHLTL